jgi:hypothetical protein
MTNTFIFISFIGYVMPGFELIFFVSNSNLISESGFGKGIESLNLTLFLMQSVTSSSWYMKDNNLNNCRVGGSWALPRVRESTDVPLPYVDPLPSSHWIAEANQLVADEMVEMKKLGLAPESLTLRWDPTGEDAPLRIVNCFRSPAWNEVPRQPPVQPSLLAPIEVWQAAARQLALSCEYAYAEHCSLAAEDASLLDSSAVLDPARRTESSLTTQKYLTAHKVDLINATRKRYQIGVDEEIRRAEEAAEFERRQRMKRRRYRGLLGQ